MAALLLRGKEAKKLNFPISKYLDGEGNVIMDQGIKERLERKRYVLRSLDNFNGCFLQQAKGSSLNLTCVGHWD